MTSTTSHLILLREKILSMRNDFNCSDIEQIQVTLFHEFGDEYPEENILRAIEELSIDKKIEDYDSGRY